MQEPILRIEPKRYSGETTVTSLRLSKELVKDIDSIAAATGYSRNEIMTMSMEFALKHMHVGE